MATIRPQMIAPVDYSGSNRLLQAAQQQILGGLGNFGDLVTGLRNDAIKQNTASAVGTLLGAQNQGDLAQRQQQVSSMLQGYKGDVDADAVNRAAATMPDTLLSRASNQLGLTNQQNQLDDQNLAGQAYSLIAKGDLAGASQIAQNMHDPSKVIGMGLDAQARQQQLAIQQQQLAQSGSNQAASLAMERQRLKMQQQQYQQGREDKQSALQYILGGGLPPGVGGQPTQGGGAGAGSPLSVSGGMPGTATKLSGAGQKDAIQNASTLNSQNTSQDDVSTAGKNNLDTWTTSNDSWSGKYGSRVKDLAGKLPGFTDLPPALQKNLLDIGLESYKQNSGISNMFGSTNPESAAMDAMNSALNQHGKNQQNTVTLQSMQNLLEAQQAEAQKRQSLLLQYLR